MCPQELITMVDTGRISQEHDAIMSDFSWENDMPKCTW